ncbi:MAG: 6-hydroxymethylpterin diphosphokinase MptE-like protein [Vicinamibacterales bacterium]
MMSRAGHQAPSTPRSSAEPPAAEIVLQTDAVEHAWQWLRRALKDTPVPRVIGVVGLGDGSLLEALDRHAPGSRVLAIEPDPAAAATFLARSTWHAWHATGRLAYLAGPDYGGADEAWRIFPIGVIDPPVLITPGSQVPESAKAVLTKILFGVRANDTARRRFAPRSLVNAIRNLPAVAGGSDVRAFAGALTGVPAVIAAAGPSLDDALDELRTCADRAFLIAADTALRPLLTAGINPPVVVGLDPSTTNARHLLNLPECRDTWLVAESALDRQATAAFESRTFWFRASNHHPWPWLNDLGLEIGGLSVWGSVLTAAFELACLAGCDPIVIVGADLSYTGGHTYARGTTYEREWLRAAATLVPVETVWSWSVEGKDSVRTPDLRGIDTATSPFLLSFRDWMVAHAQRSGRRVINASGAGMLFGDGIEQAALTDVLTRSVDMPTVASLARRLPGVKPTVLAARLRAVRDAIDVDARTTPPLPAWREFAGDGFDAQALGEALNEAAHTLETKRGVPASAPTLTWPPTGAEANLYRRLPEATTRYRAALSGLPVPSLPADGWVEPHAVLDHSWTLLVDIRRAIDALPALQQLVDTTDAPVSVAYDWPEDLRVSIEVFEGLLGKVWPDERPFTPDALRPAASLKAAACELLAYRWLICSSNAGLFVGGLRRATEPVPAMSAHPQSRRGDPR